MVILHIKRTDLNQFLYETNTSVPVDELLKTLVQRKLTHKLTLIFSEQPAPKTGHG